MNDSAAAIEMTAAPLSVIDCIGCPLSGLSAMLHRQLTTDNTPSGYVERVKICRWLV
jgi:hypothetical protein